MFSLAQIISTPSIAALPLRGVSIRSAAGSENYFVACRASSRDRLVVRMRCSDQSDVVELSRVGRVESGGLAEESGSDKVEAVLKRGWMPSDFDSALNRLSKWLVSVLFSLVILWKHDAEALWAAMGSVANAWLSTVLKQVLNHERPSALRDDPGMPSSHAQSIFYAAVFAVASFTRAKGINAFTVGVGVFALLCGSYLSWLRVSRRLHTMNQVLVGAAVGSAYSLTWFWLWHSLVLQAFTHSVWVRIFVVLSSASSCAAFLIYVIRNWLQEDFS